MYPRGRKIFFFQSFQLRKFPGVGLGTLILIMLASLTSCARRAACATPARSITYAQKLPASERLYLGLDSSTQGLKATAIDADLKVHASFAVNFQKDLPHYALTNGVHAKAGNVVTQPTLMVRGGRGARGAPARGKRPLGHSHGDAK